jgi:hypothetical protein
MNTSSGPRFASLDANVELKAFTTFAPGAAAAISSAADCPAGVAPPSKVA